MSEFMTNGGINTPSNGATGNWWDDMFGDTNMGTIGKGLNTAANLASAWGNLGSLDLAEEQFQFGKGVTLANLGNQANLTNSQLTDRQDQRNRNAANNGTLDNGGSILSTADYMAQFGVSGVPGQSYAQQNPQQNNAPVNNTPPPELSQFGRV